jgi:hypothetical protein
MNYQIPDIEDYRGREEVVPLMRAEAEGLLAETSADLRKKVKPIVRDMDVVAWGREGVLEERLDHMSDLIDRYGEWAVTFLRKRRFIADELHEKILGKLSGLEKRYGEEFAQKVFFNSRLFQEVDFEGSEKEVWEYIFEKISYIFAAELTGFGCYDTKVMRESEDPMKWLEHRRQMMRDLWGEEDYEDSALVKALLNTDEESYEVLKGDDVPMLIKRFAFAQLEKGTTLKKYRGKLAEKLREKVEFIKEAVPLKLIESHISDGSNINTGHFSRFIRRRPSFLSALRSYLGEEEWQEVLKDDEQCMYYENIATATWVRYSAFNDSEEGYREFAERDEVPIVADEVIQERDKEMICDIIETGGLSELTKRVVGEIKLTQLATSAGTIGGELNMKLALNGKHEKVKIVRTFLHELGHAVMFRIHHHEEGLMLRDEYLMHALDQRTDYSDYANANAYMNRPSWEKQNLSAFFTESFADDFKLYILYPKGLSEKKRDVFNRLMAVVFPDIDVEEVRRKTAGMLLAFFGKSGEDLIEETGSDEEVREFARYIEQRGKRSKRDGKG